MALIYIYTYINIYIYIYIYIYACIDCQRMYVDRFSVFSVLISFLSFALPEPARYSPGGGGQVGWELGVVVGLGWVVGVGAWGLGVVVRGRVGLGGWGLGGWAGGWVGLGWLGVVVWAFGVISCWRGGGSAP